MDLSLFPRGRYYVKKATIRYKNPYPPSGRKPFALMIERGPAKAASVWDLNAFRPDPRVDEDVDAHLRGSKGVEALVLYESVNFTDMSGTESCHKVPRYILVGDQKNGKWIVNVR